VRYTLLVVPDDPQPEPPEPDQRKTSPEHGRRVSADGRLVERDFGPPSRQSQAIRQGLRLGIYPFAHRWRFGARGIRLARRVLDPTPIVPVLGGTKTESRRIGDVPVEWVRAPRALREPSAHDRVILYLHGGGFVLGSARSHRNLAARFSHVTASPVLVVEYRMAPEHSLAVSQADAFAAYRHLLDHGYGPESIVIAGDSAGGSLALHIALTAAEAGTSRVVTRSDIDVCTQALAWARTMHEGVSATLLNRGVLHLIHSDYQAAIADINGALSAGVEDSGFFPAYRGVRQQERSNADQG